MAWLESRDLVDDIFVFVSNGNTDAQTFYARRGFRFSHDVQDGFITALRT